MFKSLFGSNQDQDGLENDQSDNCYDEENPILRSGIFKILSTQIAYDPEEEHFYTLATCINEIDEIETIYIDGFKIDKNVSNLAGAYIDYEEFEDGCSGRIFTSDQGGMNIV